MLLLSHDSKYLFSASGSVLNVYSATSGEIVYRLSYTDNSEESNNNEVKIVSLCLNPYNKYQLFTFHLNSVICLWDYEDGLLLKSFELKIKIKKIYNVKNSIYAIGELKKSSKNENDSISLYKLQIDNSIKNKNLIEHELIVSNLSINLDKLQFAIDQNEKYVAYIEGRRKLVINQFKSNNSVKKFQSKIELTCLALHPNEDCIATGTTSGKIIIWYNYINCAHINSEEDSNGKKRNLNSKPTESVLHWHSLPVVSLSFTTEGSILYSGGHECVLVKWLFKTGQKDFKPRLGAPISSITSSLDNTFCAVKHLDNTIHLIGANMKVVQTFSSFLCPNFKTTNKDLVNNMDFTFYPIGLNYFKKLNCIVTNGRPGHLQFYSYSSDKLLFNLDIVNENYISPENLNKPNAHTEIECLAFNHDSTWLVTVERRNDSVTTPEIKLKFWCYDSTNNKFSLNTLVRHPHSYDKITKLKFKPNENTLFTCGEDGCFKSWTLVKNRPSSIDQNQIKYNWVYSTCNGYRDMYPSDIEFFEINNKDYVAVSFEHIATLWKIDYDKSLSFVDDLIHCAKDDPIKYLKKIDNSNLLVVHNECLNVWCFKHNVLDENDLLSGVEESLETRCIWSQEVKDVLKVETSPSNDSNVLIFVREHLKSDESLIKIKIGSIEISNNSEPSFKYCHEFVQDLNGLVNFVVVPNDSIKRNEEFSLENVHILYADNFGIIKKVKKSSLSNENLLQNNADVDLNETMWENRKILAKNLPESNLARIIDTNKSNRINGEKDQFIEENRNGFFESNLNRIETTPAYLMPKIGTFCYDTLRSMLFKLDEKKYEMQNGL
ncbi:unnamed protein product [Brachionus calyciflorus]|uniref:WD repeat-containing protein 75 second beta-propeller domain-containing protein n=1 Tax=Brachionus calyciflorus TaxID=104777 RepID=A0A813M3Y7_9BILA|nr:unnamed protein product [Brachionus calyciflorus]